MASNPYVNKVQTADGTTMIDISDTTAEASDVASGKYFYAASGAKTLGTRTGGGNYYITTETPNSVGTAVVGDAETGTPNYTPSGDIVLEGEGVEVVVNNTAELTWDYANYRLSLSVALTPIMATIPVPTRATFIGSGVNLLVKEETE